MKKTALASLLIAQTCMAAGAVAQEAAGAPVFTVTVGDIENGQPIPEKYAYCAPDGNGKTKNGGDVNPATSWSGAPAGTQSYALFVIDPDVPASFELANKDDKSIPADFARRNFYHWVLVDIPAGVAGIAEGQNSNGVTEGGKPGGGSPYGLNGINDFPGGGYDGPCPPWNDERLHHYHYILYALNVSIVNVQGAFNGQQAEASLEGHILAKSEVVGTYTNNQKLITK